MGGDGACDGVFGVVVDDGDVPSGCGYASGAVDVFGGRPGGWMYVVVRHLTVGGCGARGGWALGVWGSISW